MIDQNGIFTTLDLSTAMQKVLTLATNVGITVSSGSVEEQLANLLSQFWVMVDTGEYKSYQVQFNPVGSDIDLQNPNTPRLQASIAHGFLDLSNSTGSPILIPLNSNFTAPNGNVYTTGNNTVSVPAHGEVDIYVYSVNSGIAQNLPANQTFTHVFTGITAVNSQPFVDARDKETDTQYLNRIIFNKTNYASQQASSSAVLELLQYYSMAKILVNNNNNATALPIIIPPQGYLAIVNFTSGISAGLVEINQALQIMANRFEFGNPLTTPTTLHPILSGTIFSGTYPEIYYVTPAQAVKSTITASLTIKFLPFINDAEEIALANAFAKFFVQNLINYFGGAAGNFSCVFNPVYGSPTTTSIPVLAAKGSNNVIGPMFSIEQIRALISDQVQISTLYGLEYKACTALQMILDPQQVGESTINVNISGGGGTVNNIDFSKTALFTDGSSWYDRYVYLDPSLITITINETYT